MRVVRSVMSLAIAAVTLTAGGITAAVIASRRHPRSVYGINKGRAR